MPTRFYFDNDTAPSISPAFDAAWEQTGQADRRVSPRKGMPTVVSPLGNQGAITVPITTTQQILSRQFITEPLPFNVRIACRLNMVIRVLQSVGTANVFLAWVLRVVTNDGATVRATLGSSLTNVGTEYLTTAATRIFSATGLTAATAQAGDRLCLELGGHAQAPTGAGTYTHRYGFTDAGDFALTSALTTDLNPWWELDQDIWPPLPNNYLGAKAQSGISVSERTR
jgi:hypothetical protein